MMGARHGSKILMILSGLFLCLVFLMLFRDGTTKCNENTIVCAPDRTPVYADVLPKLFPEYEVHTGNGQVLTYLERGGIVEAMDVQAHAMRSEGLARYWYPQYMATVVIAVDRNLTEKSVSGWSDLPRTEERIAVVMDVLEMPSVSLALAYGLDGENYTSHSAANLLKGLRRKGLLETKSFDAPILICYDYQAAALRKAGRNLEIIIPREGTFCYEMGLLSNTKMPISPDMDERLLTAGLRLPDGRCDPALYPDAAAYLPAVPVPDYAHYSRLHLNSDPILRRQALGVRLYTSADGREHQLTNTFFIAAVLLWAASVVSRAMQKRVQRGAMIAAALLIGWITLRLLKWQIMLETTLARYLWFTYVPFQIAIIFLLLWLAWGIDKPEGAVKPPLWLRVVAFCNMALILLFFTNDLHGLAYLYDLTEPGWLNDYGHGAGYYLAMAACALQLFMALGMLIIRHMHSPRRKGIIFPVLLCVISILYGYGYVNRIPLARESDVVMVIAVLSVLFFEASIRSGIIPVNTKYKQFFTHSPLSIQIIEKDGNVALSSKTAVPLDEKTTASILSGDAQPTGVNEDTLVFSKGIAGGFTVWREDISLLNRLHEQIAASVESLKRDNAVLARNAKIKREIEEEKAKNQLMDGLEAEISGKMEELSGMIRGLSRAEDQKRETARIAMSLCYIKRRSDFFFSEQEASSIGVSELLLCTEELSEYAALAGTDIRSVNELGGCLPARLANLVYSFFGEALLHAAKCGYSRILSRLCFENGCYVIWLMLPDDGNAYAMGSRLAEDARALGGMFTVKDFDDAIGISLSIPAKRGDGDG